MSQKPVTHTPEPWAVSDSPYGSIVSNASKEIRKSWCLPTHDSGRNYGYDVAVANARRIVACVNACEGVPDFVLENGGVGIVRAQHAAIVAQRDELLAALKLANGALSQCKADAGYYPQQIAASIAINNAITKVEQS